MLRFYVPLVILAGVTALVACSARDPVADGANNAGAAPAEVDVLPPDESAAAPTNDLEDGGDEDANAGGGSAAIPPAFHGRWGMTPGDCTSTRGDAKGLMVVSADGIRFYESLARPAPNVKTSANSISGYFAFTGEGTTWNKYEVIDLKDGKLVRTESDPMTSYSYARCTG
jgi:hypothetical protein